MGKTTLAGVMARCLASAGHKILAIDADPDSNLASAIGIDDSLLDTIKPLAQMTEFIEERTASKRSRGELGSFFRLNPKVDDIPEKFALEKDGIKLVVLGNIPQGGGGCFCAENVLLKSLLTHVLIERDEYVLVDMEAGLEHLGRGSTAYIDALIVVCRAGASELPDCGAGEEACLRSGHSPAFFVAGNKVADSRGLGPHNVAPGRPFFISVP